MKKPESLSVPEGSGINSIDPLTLSLVDVVAVGGGQARPGEVAEPPAPPPPVRKPAPKPTVWMACRSQRPCGGNQATLELVTNLKTGGRVSRYKCSKCGKKFGVFY